MVRERGGRGCLSFRDARIQLLPAPFVRERAQLPVPRVELQALPLRQLWRRIRRVARRADGKAARDDAEDDADGGGRDCADGDEAARREETLSLERAHRRLGGGNAR